VSFHLGVLKKAGLIKDRKQGKWIHYRIDDSNMFRRFLLLSVFERVREESVKDDRKRLKNFLKYKSEKSNVISLDKRTVCCGR